MSINLIRELSDHYDRAQKALCAIALSLSEEQRDRPAGVDGTSLRAAFWKIYTLEYSWHDRMAAPRWREVPYPNPFVTSSDLVLAASRLAEARAAWLATLDADSMEWGVAMMRAEDGPIRLVRLDDALIHLHNHAIQQRAWMLNCLRLQNAPTLKFGGDYIFLYLEDPDRPAPPLEVETLRRYFAYGDWAFRRVLDEAARLNDEQLDRPFEMGLGTLRKTLVHIHQSECWWLGNWRNEPLQDFASADDGFALPRLRELFERTAEQRDAFIAAQTEPDIRRPVRAFARQGDPRHFPLGVTMLQLCCHGTHHRAQAVSMLRRLGVAAPRLGWIYWAIAG